MFLATSAIGAVAAIAPSIAGAMTATTSGVHVSGTTFTINGFYEGHAINVVGNLIGTTGVVTGFYEGGYVQGADTHQLALRGFYEGRGTQPFENWMPLTAYTDEETEIEAFYDLEGNQISGLMIDEASLSGGEEATGDGTGPPADDPGADGGQGDTGDTGTVDDGSGDTGDGGDTGDTGDGADTGDGSDTGDTGDTDDGVAPPPIVITP